MRKFLGSTFYTAFIVRKAPGTSTSLVIFTLFYFVDLTPSQGALSLLFVGLLHVISFPFFEDLYKNDDPAVYTLDETFAVVLLSLFISSKELWIAAFFLFRFFDIVKPLGIRTVEKVNQIPGVVRNVLDDVIAAVYALVIVKVIEYVL